MLHGRWNSIHGQCRHTGNHGRLAPRITIITPASLYTLGVAYQIAPAKIEGFLAKIWPVISTLLTDHGPWEGFDTVKKVPIKFQTTAHTLSLTLGLLGHGSGNMHRYLEFKRLGQPIERFYGSGESLDLLGKSTRIFAWADKDAALQSKRANGSFQVTSDRATQLGIALVSNIPSGMNISSGRLKLHYRSSTALDPAMLDLKAASQPRSRSELDQPAGFICTSACDGRPQRRD